MRANWSTPLRISLADGRKLATLADARALMLASPDLWQDKERWLQAGELLLKAARGGKKHAVMDAKAQLTAALKFDGLI